MPTTTSTPRSPAPPGVIPKAAGPRWAPEPGAPSPPPEAVFAAGLQHHHLANTAYPISHKRTIWTHRCSDADAADALAEAFHDHSDIGLYAHIPFCERRCAFCEYAVLPSHDSELEERYHHALLAELDLAIERVGLGQRHLTGFDIGGGTPSLIAPHRIAELVARVTGASRLGPGFAMSIETTPKIAASRPENLRAYRAAGIDRISMGLQMVNPRLTRRYGRDLNTVGHNRHAADNIHRAGFAEFNIDLMYGFAHQSLEDLNITLEATIRLVPDVITLYRMRYKGTRIDAEATGIDHRKVAAMYRLAHRILNDAGYRANIGKNTFSRREGTPGTSAYLTSRVVEGAPYLGLGLAAQSFTTTHLAYNLGAAEKRLAHYLRAVDAGRLPIQDIYHLPRSHAAAKMVAVSFYFGEIDTTNFECRFHVPFAEFYAAEVDFALTRDLMEWRGTRFGLTAQGADNLPGVIALFYAAPVKNLLLGLES